LIENFKDPCYRQLIIDNIMNGIVMTDREQKIIYCNPSYLEAVDYTIEELKNTYYPDIVSEDFKEREITGEENFQSKRYESVHIKKDGSPVHFLVKSIYVPAIEKDIPGYVFIFNNITAYKEREKELQINDEKIKVFTKQLAQAHSELLDSKISAEAANTAKSLFLASMSHEIKTPLSSIIGISEILAEEEMPPEEVKDMADVITKSAKKLFILLNDILDLSKIEAGKFVIEKRETDLRGLVSEILALMKVKTSEKNISLELDCSPELPDIIVTDELRFRQIINNLTGNAIKFTSRGYVKLSCHLSEDREFFLFSIKDTGIGIPEEKQKTIFEPFTQAEDSTTRNYGGTGLGLTITEKLINLLGGNIWLESKVGSGTTFYFTLPISASPGDITVVGGELEEEPQVEIREDKIIEEQRERNRTDLKILIVDDKEEERLYLKKIFRNAGYCVEESSGGAETLKLFEENKKEENKKIDLIVIDIDMTQMNGIEITKKIRSFPGGDKIRIIGCTSSIEEYIEEFMEAGFDDYILKPPGENELLSIAAKFMG